MLVSPTQLLNGIAMDYTHCCDKKTHVIFLMSYYSLVPRPLPPFLSKVGVAWGRG